MTPRPLVVQVELTSPTATLLQEILRENPGLSRPNFAWPGGPGAIPDVGDSVFYTELEDYPMQIVSRRWEIHPQEFRLILQIGIVG